MGNLQIFHKDHVYLIIKKRSKSRKINMVPRETKTVQLQAVAKVMRHGRGKLESRWDSASETR